MTVDEAPGMGCPILGFQPATSEMTWPRGTVRSGGAVWRNTESEREWFSASVTRSDKDDSDPLQWRQATTFGRVYKNLVIEGGMRKKLIALIAFLRFHTF
jgi:hypothetical protein